MNFTDNIIGIICFILFYGAAFAYLFLREKNDPYNKD